MEDSVFLATSSAPTRWPTCRRTRRWARPGSARTSRTLAQRWGMRLTSESLIPPTTTTTTSVSLLQEKKQFWKCYQVSLRVSFEGQISSELLQEDAWRVPHDRCRPPSWRYPQSGLCCKYLALPLTKKKKKIDLGRSESASNLEHQQSFLSCSSAHCQHFLTDPFRTFQVNLLKARHHVTSSPGRENHYQW